MPPKKKNEKEVKLTISPLIAKLSTLFQVEKTVLIGRMGTNLKVGIVGLPNVGKVQQKPIKPSSLSLIHI